MAHGKTTCRSESQALLPEFLRASRRARQQSLPLGLLSVRSTEKAAAAKSGSVMVRPCAGASFRLPGRSSISLSTD
jgi:hypothetical protein